MGNNTSTEIYRESFLPPSPSRPLPPIPPPPGSSLPPHKLSKPRTRIRSTAGLFRSPDGFAKGISSERYSNPDIAHVAPSSFSSPNTPAPPPSAAPNYSRPLPPLPPLPSPISPLSPALNSSVFTFEEAVVAVTGQRDPAAWRPISSVYPTPSLDLELLQEQQLRQIEFEKRQRQNQVQYQQLQLQLQQRRELEGQRQNHQPEADIDDDGLELQNRLRQKKRLSKRHSFFRSKSSRRPVEPHLDQDSRRRKSISSAYPYSDVQHKWDNAPMTYDQVLSQYYGGPISENWPSQAGSRASWNYDMSSYAAKRLLHIVDDTLLDQRFEQGSVASESRNSVLSEVTWKSSHPVRPESPTLARANSDLSLYAPVRRRSVMQVPGVATRRNSSSSYVSGGGASVRPNFRHSHPATPSLSRRTSSESIGSRGVSMPPLQRPSVHDFDDAVPRATTPCEGDYTAIGGYKFGSLRITNGAASPMSSPETTKTQKTNADTPEPIRSPGFDFTARTQALAALSANETAAQEGGAAAVQEAKSQKTSGNKHGNDDRTIQPSPTFFEPSLGILTTAALGSTASVQNVASVKKAAPAKLPKIELPREVFAGFEFSSFSAEEALSAQAASMSSAPAVAMLQTTSKATAMDDQLFEEDDHSTSEYAAAEVLDVRLDPNAKSTTNRAKAAILASRKSAPSEQSVSRSDSGFVSSPTSESSHKPLSKADSGYSSNVSLRSFKHAASKLMGPVAAKAAVLLSSDKDSSALQSPRRESFFIDELKLPSPTIDAPEMAFLATTPPLPLPATEKPSPPTALPPPPPPERNVPLPPHREAPPPPPLKDLTPMSPISVSITDTSAASVSNTSLPGLISDSTSLAHKRLTASGPQINVQPASRPDSQPSPKTSPNPATPVSVKSNGSIAALSVESGTQRPNKLLRLLSFAGNTAAKTSPAVQITKVEDEGDVPSVPTKPKDRSHERVTMFPIKTRRLSLKAQMSKDTLKTIFSVGSLEIHSNGDAELNVTTQSITKSEGSAAELSQSSTRRHTFQVVPSSIAFAATAAMMPLKKATTRKARPSMDAADEDGRGEEHRLEQQRDSAEMAVLGINGTARTKRRSKDRRHWRKGDERQTPSPESVADDEAELATFRSVNSGLGANPYDAATIAVEDEQPPFSRPSSGIIGRTMSLTAQLERTLNMKLSFPRLSRPTTAGSAFSSATADAPPMPAFDTSADGLILSPSLPSPLFAEVMAQQKRTSITSEAMAAASPPVSARMQQIRPATLRVPPPLRPQSTPPREASSRRVTRQHSQDSLYNAASAQYHQPTGRLALNTDIPVFAGAMVASPPPINSPQRQPHPNWEVQTDHDKSGLPSRRRPQSFDEYSRRSSMEYNSYGRRESFESGRSNPMVSSRGQANREYQGSQGPRRALTGNIPQSSFMAPVGTSGQQDYIQNGNRQPPPMLRHRASYDGYSNNLQQGWNEGGGYAPSQYNPPRMSNGYTAQTGDPWSSARRRSGSGSSSGGDSYRQQQQQTWDYYYQQYARPPPNVPRNSHHRNRSMGSQHGPNAPYRILHSYNSPAYRGVPIWG